MRSGFRWQAGAGALTVNAQIRQERAMPLPFDRFLLSTRCFKPMDGEQSIAEIECLERIFAVPDTRPLTVPSENLEMSERMGGIFLS